MNNFECTRIGTMEERIAQREAEETALTEDSTQSIGAPEGWIPPSKLEGQVRERKEDQGKLLLIDINNSRGQDDF